MNHIGDDNEMVPAVDWLINQLTKANLFKTEMHPNNILFSQARKLQEKQIKSAWHDGNLIGRNGFLISDESEYYKETYGKSNL